MRETIFFREFKNHSCPFDQSHDHNLWTKQANQNGFFYSAFRLPIGAVVTKPEITRSEFPSVFGFRPRLGSA
jgi:hypothetical protein